MLSIIHLSDLSITRDERDVEYHSHHRLPILYTRTRYNTHDRVGHKRRKASVYYTLTYNNDR